MSDSCQDEGLSTGDGLYAWAAACQWGIGVSCGAELRVLLLWVELFLVQARTNQLLGARGGVGMSTGTKTMLVDAAA